MAMKDRNLIGAGVAAVAAAICCGTSVVVAAIGVAGLGTAGLMAWLAACAYVLIPVLLICLALSGLRFRRRQTSGQVRKS